LTNKNLGLYGLSVQSLDAIKSDAIAVSYSSYLGSGDRLISVKVID
jgi:hypothetical protein